MDFNGNVESAKRFLQDEVKKNKTPLTILLAMLQVTERL